MYPEDFGRKPLVEVFPELKSDSSTTSTDRIRLSRGLHPGSPPAMESGLITPRALIGTGAAMGVTSVPDPPVSAKKSARIKETRGYNR